MQCIANITGVVGAAIVRHRTTVALMEEGMGIIIPGFGAYKILGCKPTNSEGNHCRIFEVVVEAAPQRINSNNQPLAAD